MQLKQFLTTNRTDSLQYNGANSSLQSISALRELELSTSRSLRQILIARSYPKRHGPPPHIQIHIIHIRCIRHYTRDTKCGGREQGGWDLQEKEASCVAEPD